MQVRGLTRVEVGSEEEALAQWFLGEQGRSTSATVLNACSSRSHALFTVHVEARASADARERALLSKLHLVDLAGSERPKKSGADGDALREAAAINKSLSYLEQVVNALARRDAHVPFRCGRGARHGRAAVRAAGQRQRQRCRPAAHTCRLLLLPRAGSPS